MTTGVSIRYGKIPVSEIHGRIRQRDPRDGQPQVGYYDWTIKDVDPETERKPGFTAALTEDIRKNGFRNPILLYAFEKGNYAAFGINRLRAAQRLNHQEVPVIVNDHVGRFAHFRELRSIDEMAECFTDKPIEIKVTRHGMSYFYGINRRTAGFPKLMESIPDDSPFQIRYVEDCPTEEIIWKLVRNPAYGGTPSGHPKGYPVIPFKEYETMHVRKPEFHVALEEDVKANGIRNPVIVQNLPAGLCLQFGGSRLRVCKNAGLPDIRALVVDYTGRWKDRPEVTPENWQEFFADVPANFEFNDEGCDYHYALERRRRHEYDSAGFDWLNGEEPDWLRREFEWLYENE